MADVYNMVGNSIGAVLREERHCLLEFQRKSMAAVTQLDR
jgi:hypothetical protein